MLKILISLLFVKFLVAEEFKFQTHDLTQVISKIKNKITAEMIDNDSLPYSEAKEIYDKINSEFEERKARFKNKLLKLSIDASYLNREIKERKDEIVSIENLIKRKSNKLEQLKADIKSEKEFIRKLKNLANRVLRFNSNISTQGYFVTFVENRRSVSRDKFVAKAIEKINQEAIQQLNGILVETIAKYNKELSYEIRETSSGTAISDSSDTTIKIFFTKNRSRSALIYGTKVDVYPFEKGKLIKEYQNPNGQVQYIILIRDKKDIQDLVRKITAQYPDLEFDKKNLISKIQKAITEIDIHNKKSEEVIKQLDKNHKAFIKKINNRIKSRQEIIKVLAKHQQILQEDISELNLDLSKQKRNLSILEDKFTLLQKDIIELKKSITFARAEMYDRKHANAVLETKNIVKELLKDIDKSILKTSKRIETIFNGSKIIKDIVDEVDYEKIYLQAQVIPYFITNTNRTGALVTLEIKFIDKKLKDFKIQHQTEFVHISAGSFRYGSNRGDKDEMPVKTVTIKSDFYIGKYEVTVGEYMEFAEATRSHYPEWYNNLKSKKYRHSCFDENCPIVGISWEDAQAYAKWLSKRDNQKYRLPTEQEWEYVAKCDLNLDYGFLYGKLKDYSWFNQNTFDKIHKVGLKKPNLNGVYDMHGNVWEWCQNSYSGDYKAMRGGDFRTTKYYLRSSNRAKYHKKQKSASIGFRLVKLIK